jgi:hypothetical protein
LRTREKVIRGVAWVALMVLSPMLAAMYPMHGYELGIGTMVITVWLVDTKSGKESPVTDAPAAQSHAIPGDLSGPPSRNARGQR